MGAGGCGAIRGGGDPLVRCRLVGEARAAKGEARQVRLKGDERTLEGEGSGKLLPRFLEILSNGVEFELAAARAEERGDMDGDRPDAPSPDGVEGMDESFGEHTARRL